MSFHSNSPSQIDSKTILSTLSFNPGIGDSNVRLTINNSVVER